MIFRYDLFWYLGWESQLLDSSVERANGKVTNSFRGVSDEITQCRESMTK